MSDRDNAIVRMPYWLGYAKDLADLDDEGPHTPYYNERMLSFILLEMQMRLAEMTAERDKLIAAGKR